MTPDVVTSLGELNRPWHERERLCRLQSRHAAHSFLSAAVSSLSAAETKVTPRGQHAAIRHYQQLGHNWFTKATINDVFEECCCHENLITTLALVLSLVVVVFVSRGWCSRVGVVRHCSI